MCQSIGDKLATRLTADSLRLEVVQCPNVDQCVGKCCVDGKGNDSSGGVVKKDWGHGRMVPTYHGHESQAFVCQNIVRLWFFLPLLLLRLLLLLLFLWRWILKEYFAYSPKTHCGDFSGCMCGLSGADHSMLIQDKAQGGLMKRS